MTIEKHPKKPKIVIVGGGAAGLELATALGKKLGKKGLADITLLDATHTHIWKPLLHEVAAGILDSAEEIEYLAHGHLSHFRFRLGRMEGLDRKNKAIYVAPNISESGEELIPRRVFKYDILVMAIGSISNTFGTKGVDEYCMFLDSTSQAYRLQKKLVEKYIKFHAGVNRTPGEKLSIAIVGAGATGVELSAELYEVSRMLAVYGLEQANDVKITIIESHTRLLPALPDRLANATQQQLMKLGINLKLGSRVTEVTESGVKTKDGEFIPADLKVWAAGVKAPDWMKQLDGLETNRINQLVVTQRLETEDPNIYAMGDCAACPWPGPVTPSAIACA